MEHPQEKNLDEISSSPTIEDENQDSFLENEDVNNVLNEPYKVLARKYRPQIAPDGTRWIPDGTQMAPR